MKFYKILILSVLFCYTGQAQISSSLPELTFPHPSANGLMTLVTNPVDYFTGIPDININLGSLKTYSNQIGGNASLTYHPSGVSLRNKVSDVGMGWNLHAGGTISKIVKNDPDFKNHPNITGPTNDDIFVYNFMGYSGQFRVNKVAGAGYAIDYLTPTTLKIEFLMNNNGSSSTGIKFDEVDSFVIYDEYGTKYEFNVYDEKYGTFILNWLPQPGVIPPEYQVGATHFSAHYRSTYHLKEVRNTNNKKLLEFDYQQYSMDVNSYAVSSVIEFENKLTAITSIGHGKIEFDYTFYNNASPKFTVNPNSNFKLNHVVIKDVNHTLIKKYEFVYGTHQTEYNYDKYVPTNLQRRILTELKEYNNDSSAFLSTKFYYDHPSLNATPLSYCIDFNYGRDGDGYLNLKSKEYPVIENAFPNDIAPQYATWYTEPSLVTTGVLSKIIYPTGGSTLYEFESNTYSGGNDSINTPEEIYFDSIYSPEIYYNAFNENINTLHTFPYNTTVANSFNFTVTGSGTKMMYFDFEHVPFYSQTHTDPNEALVPNYTITGPNGFFYDFGVFNSTIGLDTYYPCVGKRVDLEPGNYTIHINVFYYDASTTGQIRIKDKTPNYPLQKYFYGYGMRIKKIGVYKNATANSISTLDDNLIDYKEFDYTDFNDPYKSSWNSNFDDMYNPYFQGNVYYDSHAPMYFNVKVTSGKNKQNGYEKFTYLRFSELPLEPTNGKLYRNLYYQYKNGFLKKHEVYNNSNLKVREVENLYSYLVDPNFFTWVYVSSQKNKDLSYPVGSTTPNVVETTQLFDYYAFNKKIAESSVINSYGETLSTKYFYHTGNTSFSQNRIAEIERVETYRGSELLSKSKVNYGVNWQSTVSFLPEVILTSKGNSTLENRVVYTQYDEFNNPVQLQQENGTPVCYIWGYQKTKPIAKIENATYSQVAQYEANLQTLSNGTNENSLKQQLNALRTALPNAMITTYTYKPLVGISSITDPKGDELTYYYDKFNRLLMVKDKENNILSENSYHYKTQSTDQNYIKTTTYKVPTLSSISNPSAAQAVVQVQYFDGLGRPIQQKIHKQSTSGKDIVTHIEYDDYGRQVRDYMPYVTTTASLDFESGALAATTGFYNTPYYENTQNPYSEKLVEASPLNRTLKQAAPGNAWAMNSGKEIKFAYQSNSASEVVQFKAITTWNSNLKQYDIQLTKDNYFPANTLYKIITKDENWVSGLNNTTEEFKNKQGQVILKRTYSEGDPHDTYYVYDVYGNLTFVIPPLVNASYTVTSNILDQLGYQYKYDHRNRLIEKKLPGKTWEFIVYDKLDRPVLAGPAYNPFNGIGLGWLVTKYDAFGRVVYTGWTSDSTISPERRYQLQSTVDNFTGTIFETKTTSSTTIDAISVYYSNTAYPNSNMKLLTVNYYDNYVYPNAPPVPSSVEGENVLTDVKGLPTGSWVRVLESASQTNGELSYSFYDKKSRPLLSHTKNHQGGFTETLLHYNPDGTTQYAITNHKFNTSSTLVTYQETFDYTPNGKLLTHKHQIPNHPETLLTHNTYDELGRLVAKDVGGNDVSTFNGLQKVDYNYNIRGWLTAINDVDDLSQSPGLKDDLFGFKINYNIVDDSLDDTVKELYNGNISEIYWRTASDDKLRKYGYAYDHLNRLKDAYYQRPGSGNPNPGNYNEHLTYDKNGNIGTLIRNGEHDDLEAPLEIDDLEYHYDGNQLQTVIDHSLNPNGFKDSATNEVPDYGYDEFGNMIHDENKGIQEITYNHLNLPITIDFGDGKNIHYLYTAQGKKVSKLVEAVTIHQTTSYDNGFQYIDSVLEFFPHAEGYVRVNKGKVSANNLYSYVYNYTDHLGNVRLSYGLHPSDQRIVIMEENHYYPFGLKHKNYNMDLRDYQIYLEEQLHIEEILIGDAVYKAKYNGKEWQDELGLNFYDYGARNYMPDIGRWGNMDALSEKYTNLSPFSYVANNVVNAIDPDGRLIIFVGGLRIPSFGLDQSFIGKRGFYSSETKFGKHGYGWQSFGAGSKNSYEQSWNLTQMFKDFHNDENVLFTSGSAGNWSSAETRMENGRQAAKRFYKRWKNGKVNLADGEAIRIVSHSQGGAHAAGFADQLRTYKDESGQSIFNIEVIYYITPHQGANISHPNGIAAFQFSHPNDAVSGEGLGWISLLNGGQHYGKIQNLDSESFFSQIIFGGDGQPNATGALGNRNGHNVGDNQDHILNVLQDFCKQNPEKCKEISLTPESKK